ncbi:MAG: RNA-binding protein [Planctomycetota bacterium]
MINIYIGNLPYDTTAEDLTHLFEGFGSVEKSAIVFDRETGRSRGFGFVEMPERAAASQAIEKLAGESFRGRPLTINEARPRGSGNSRGNYVSAAAPPTATPVAHAHAGVAEPAGFIPDHDDDPQPGNAMPEHELPPAPRTGGYSNALLDR